MSLPICAFRTKLLAVMGAAVCQPLFAFQLQDARIDYDTGGLQGAAGSIVSTNTGTNQFNGLSINEVTGATRFYNEGYTGSRAVVTNVEGGHVWSGHESLQHVSNFFDAQDTYLSNGVSSGNLGQSDRHATWVGHTIAGRRPATINEYQRGIAYGAELWSGAIATSYGSPPWSNSWGWSRGYAFTDPYSKPMLTGINGRTTDVVNSSYGFINSNDPAVAGGSSVFTVTMDGLARQSRATVVFAAGNEGPDVTALRAPGNGYNTISVGALGADTDADPYRTISTFSSRGPQSYVGPDGDFGNVRARVDITAPGQNMTLAFYGGLTGGNVGGSDPSQGANNWYTFNAQGTSFAAPTVAGGASLLADVAYDRYTPNAINARDGQVIKAVLLNSADKPLSWDNGQQRNNAVVGTSQSLDYTYGAGILNLDRAFDQFTAGTHDRMVDTDSVLSIGWDYGTIDEGDAIDYLIEGKLAEGSTFNATLNWFVGRTWHETLDTGGIVFSDDYFTDLRLELWAVENGVFDQLVAFSDAEFINTEHFSILLPETDQYGLRVTWDGERYDTIGNSIQTYGLAWSGVSAVPEPGSCAVLGACLLLAFNRRRRMSKP